MFNCASIKMNCVDRQNAFNRAFLPELKCYPKGEARSSCSRRVCITYTNH